MFTRVLTLATVVFAGETNLLRLQARSLRIFADRALLSRILIILNDPDEDALAATIERYILPEYGDLASIVEIIHSSSLCGGTDPRRDWHSQQALKLEIAAQIETPWYLLLDAKNHMIRALDAAAVFGQGLRPHGWVQKPDENFQVRREVCLRLMGMEDETVDCLLRQPALPYVTPMAMSTSLVRDMLCYFSDVLKQPVLDCIRQEKAVEFLLYDAWMNHIGLPYDRLYDLNGGHSPALTFWQGSPLEGDPFTTEIKRVDRPDVYAFGLHRLLYGSMPTHFESWVTSLWIDRGLVQTSGEARTFLGSPEIEE